MTRHNLLVAALLAASLGAALPAAARTEVDFYVNTPPPAPRVEVVPAPRPGWAWVPGFWEWRGHRHVWVSGHWVRERHGYYYAPGRWVARMLIAGLHFLPKCAKDNPAATLEVNASVTATGN